MNYKNWRIEELTKGGWCSIFKDEVFQAKAIDMSEARRYIWLQLKDTEEEIDYLTAEMMSA